MPAKNSDKENMSKHILPTSANLLGLCFVILTLKQLWHADSVERVIDKLDGVAILIFLVASVLSYASMRSAAKAELYEKLADIIFLSGLFLLSVVAIVTVLELS